VAIREKHTPALVQVASNTMYKHSAAVPIDGSHPIVTLSRPLRALKEKSSLVLISAAVVNFYR